ncbi:hypothetical protein D3C85_1550860 [compost metagenome]
MGVVGDGALYDGAVGDLGVAVFGLYIFPAETIGFGAAIRQANSAVGIALAGLAWQTDADQALAGGKGDVAFGVEPSVALVLAHYRELHAVNGEQFVQC